jgi:hypothetical protein
MNFFKKYYTWIIIIVLLIVISGLLVFLNKEKSPEGKEEAEQVELPLAQGRQTYEILTNEQKTLKIVEVEVDPLDVKQGEAQTVTILVEDSDSQAITKETKIEGVVYTNNVSTFFPLTLKQIGDQESDSIFTIWQGSWVCEDPYNLNYVLSLKLSSDEREHIVNLTFR